jgi:ATP-binding cassette subfamily G (WHITE) protein 2 (PDR)
MAAEDVEKGDIAPEDGRLSDPCGSRSQQDHMATSERNNISSSSESPGTSDSDSIERPDGEAIIGEEDRQELVRVATTLSRRRSSVAVPHPIASQLGDIPEYDTALDPAHEKFDLQKWLKHFVEQLREQGLMQRHAGVVFRDLDVSGSGSALQIQQTVLSTLTAPLRPQNFLRFGKKQHKQILHNFNGLIKSGELLVVLGRPGSGCSTLLKSLCGELHGLALGEKTNIYYNGIPQKQMQKEFKGDAVYNQEVSPHEHRATLTTATHTNSFLFVVRLVGANGCLIHAFSRPHMNKLDTNLCFSAQVDKHFPHLTVSETLEFAASARTPSHRIDNMPRREFCQYVTRVVMATFGLSHTSNTKVGDDFVRGVSGGERKRVSIAEMVLAGSPFCAWDNR